MMTMYGALHPKSDVDRLKKKGGRGLISCDKYNKTEENNMGWYVKNSVEPFIVGVRKAGVLNSKECVRKDQFQ